MTLNFTSIFYLRHLAGIMRFHVNPHSVCRYISRIALGLISTNSLYEYQYVRFDRYALKIAKIFPQIFFKIKFINQ